MNANDLWRNFEYAYYQERPNGVEAPRGCRKVRVIGVSKKQVYGNTRLTAFAEVEFMDDSPGGWGWSANIPRGAIREVRARDIVDHWEDYSHMREEIEAEQAEKEEKARVAREAREAEQQRIAEEKREKQERQLNAFINYTGLPRDSVSTTPGGMFLVNNTHKLRTEVLGLPE